jgi:hypothetical protein
MKLDTILDPLMGLVDRAMKSKTGDQYAPIRVTREALRAINDVLGQPICSAAERAQRRLDRLGPVPPPPSLFRRNAPTEGTRM